MGDLVGYNQTEVEEYNGSYREISDGTHSVMITDARVVVSQRDGTDQLEIDFTAIGGDSDGVTQRFWLGFGSEHADIKRISMQQMKGIATACGIVATDAADFINQKLDIKFYTNKKGYKSLGDFSAFTGGKGNVARKPNISDDAPFDDDLPAGFGA